MTTMIQSPQRSRRRIDVPSLGLLLLGLVTGAIAYWLSVEADQSPLWLIPSVVAVTVGAMHLIKREARR